MEMTRGRGPIATALGGVMSGRIPWGDEHHGTYQQVFDKSAGMVIICEDLPELHNTVTLDPVLVDSNGIPAPKINYTLSKNSVKMLEHSVARGKEVLMAAGASEVSSGAPLGMAGWHMMGTARMGTDPGNSVVNEWGRSHDVKNLFIVDGSIFVTSAGVNPTSTIQALALYVADSMKKRLANLFD
jgi:choline dehydrogenase-like flavoprotein